MKKAHQSFDLSRHQDFNFRHRVYSCYIKSHQSKYEFVFHYDRKNKFIDRYDLKTHDHEMFSLEYITKLWEPSLINFKQDIYECSSRIFNSFLKSCDENNIEEFIQGLMFIKHLEDSYWENSITINEYYGIDASETIEFFINEYTIYKHIERGGDVKLYLDIELDEVNPETLFNTLDELKSMEQYHQFDFEDYRINETMEKGVVIRSIFVQ